MSWPSERSESTHGVEGPPGGEGAGAASERARGQRDVRELGRGRERGRTRPRAWTCACRRLLEGRRRRVSVRARLGGRKAGQERTVLGRLGDGHRVRECESSWLRDEEEVSELRGGEGGRWGQDVRTQGGPESCRRTGSLLRASRGEVVRGEARREAARPRRARPARARRCQK